MSQEKLCRFWCLLDGEEKAFPANASLEWDMAQLAKAIQQERKDLRALDNSEIVLQKVSLPSLPAYTLCSSLTYYTAKRTHSN